MGCGASAANKKDSQEESSVVSSTTPPEIVYPEIEKTDISVSESKINLKYSAQTRKTEDYEVNVYSSDIHLIFMQNKQIDIVASLNSYVPIVVTRWYLAHPAPLVKPMMEDIKAALLFADVSGLYVQKLLLFANSQYSIDRTSK